MRQIIYKIIRDVLNEEKYFSNDVNVFKKGLVGQFSNFSKLYQKINDYEFTEVSKIKKENIKIRLNLALTDDKDINTFPVDNADVRLYLINDELNCDIYITINDEYKNSTFNDLRDNIEFKGALVHELHHIISNKHLYFPNKTIDINKKNRFLNLTNKESNAEFRKLMYYLSKDELNSIIPQINIGAYLFVKDIFYKYNNMSYLEFKKIFDENSNIELNNKTYNTIKKRIRYFIKKTK
ncbi:MAG: hypothetical protein K9I82_01465 [Chitinophagaceae bacterium]|nr:hypothetical protein [Chitinophagaceae bacterium]